MIKDATKNMAEELDYETQLEAQTKKNEEYLNIFTNWLENQKLAPKTIKNHLSNVNFYINDYLNYYEVNDIKAGCYGLYSYFGDFFIRKCMWSTGYSIKTTAASLKKFYNCMLEKNIITKEDYTNLCEEIKCGLDEWVEACEDYNNFDDDLF